MIDRDRLAELILACDFTHAEMETICKEFLDLRGDAMETVLGNGNSSWQYRIVDLVSWADRQGLLSELTAGVLGYGRSKRAVREWILSTKTDAGIMGEPPSQYASLEKWLERIEARLVYVERELQRLSAGLGPRQDGSATNWTIIVISVIIAMSIAAATTILAFLR